MKIEYKLSPPPPQRTMRGVWRPCSFTLIHSHTGTVGQLFASRPGGQWFASQGCTHTYNGIGFSCKRCLATLVTPMWFDHWLCCPSVGNHKASHRRCEKPTALSPFSEHFTRLRADDVQSQHDNQSQHHMPSPFPFCYLQVILPLAIQWPVRAPVKLLGGAVWRPCSFTPIHCLTGPVGQLFASHLGGQRFASQGCTHTYNWTGFFCKRCLATGGYFFLFWEAKNRKL